MQVYDFSLVHIKGRDNEVADYLSRNEAAEEDQSTHDASVRVSSYLASIYDASTVTEDEHAEDAAYCAAVNQDSWRDYIIPEEQYQIIAKVHNCTMGHHGVENTLEKLKAMDQKWKYMRQHVQRFIKECATCQKNSYESFPISTRKYNTGTYQPFEKIGIDSIGPFPKDNEGN